MGRGLDGFFSASCRPSAVFKLHGGRLCPFRWRDSERETPLPIPNRAVKPLSADGTWRATSWESRSPPVFPRAAPRGRLFFWAFVVAKAAPLRLTGGGAICSRRGSRADHDGGGGGRARVGAPARRGDRPSAADEP